jgi:hypothetical protein
MTVRLPNENPSPDLHPASGPVRDQHGHPLPGTGSGNGTGNDAHALGPDQVDDALAALPGWRRQGSTLVRQVAVPADSRAGLREGVRRVVGAQADRLSFDEGAEGLTVLLATGAGDITAADVEAAARIDTVLSGSGTDRGSGR